VRPRARDVAFMILAALSVLAIVFGRPDEGTARVALDVVVASLGVVLLWWRRAIPLAVTLAGIVVLIVTGDPLTMLIGLFTLAIRRRDHVLVATAVGAALALIARGLIDEDWDHPWTTFLGGVLGAGFAAAAGAYVGARRDLVDSLRERAERAEHERELRADQARIGERARIAREMHDVLAHKVSLIALHAGALEVNTDDAQVRESAALIRTTATQAMDDLREVLGVLRAGGGLDDELRPPSGTDDLGRIVDASRAAGVRVALAVDAPALPDALARTAHRVVQEALTNVHKHARGAATTVTVTGDAARGVTIEVVNQRPVASDALLPGAGAGLAGLRERVGLVGGTLDAAPTVSGGWRVAAWLPWPATARTEESALGVAR
jgi:signal transduction histidine kinase